MEWLQYFHNIKVHHLTDTTSDHSPLLLAETSTIGRRRNRRFFFEAIWTRRADCKEVIEEIGMMALIEVLQVSLLKGLSNVLRS